MIGGEERGFSLVPKLCLGTWLLKLCFLPPSQAPLLTLHPSGKQSFQVMHSQAQLGSEGIPTPN